MMQWRDGRMVMRFGCLEVGEDPVGLVWAKRHELGQLRLENKKKLTGLLKEFWVGIDSASQKLFFEFSQGFWIQIKGFQISSN
jgi:hypothetical protein